MSTDYLGYVFGAVVAAGGGMGYVKKRSVPSLVAGLAFGGLAAVGAYHASSHPDTPYIGAGVSAALAGVMGSRAAKSGVVRCISSRLHKVIISLDLYHFCLF